MTVAIVTDSTSTIPKNLIEKYNLTIAPQVVIWEGKTFRDGIEISPSDFYARLENTPKENMPTTSQCTIASFTEIYKDLQAKGHEILCVLISHKLSGTISSAEQAKELVPDARVEIVDSLSCAMGLGFQALEAAKAATDGASLAECKAVAESAVPKTGVILTPETLEYLHRGGRIGGGAKFLATALNIKPVLELVDGRLEALERVRTRKKVMARVLELLVERVGDRRPLRISALHAKSEADAQALLEEARVRLNPDEAVLSEVSPAIGVHVGPGTIGITWMAG